LTVKKGWILLILKKIRTGLIDIDMDVPLLSTSMITSTHSHNNHTRVGKDKVETPIIACNDSFNLPTGNTKN
jgi:hypothetical protein